MTDVSALEVYTGQIAEAAAMSGAASKKQQEYIHGDDQFDVETESGPVPSIAKQARLSREQTAGLAGELAESTSVTVWSFRHVITYKGDPLNWQTWDWRPAVQAAIDYCASVGRKEIYFDRKYPVSLDPAAPSVANAYSAGAVAVCLKASIKFWGPGGLVLISAQGKTDGAVIGNPYVTRIAGEVIIDIEIDGNAASTTGTVSGVLLVGVQNVTIGLNARIHDVTRHGAMCRPNPSQAGMTDTVMFISSGSRVWNCGGIGLQGTRVKSFIADTPWVTNCGDNCIDVYGNDPGAGLSPGFVGYAAITNPILDGGPCGIFMESFSNWYINNPNIKNCIGGVKLNRINSGALYGKILGGSITGKEDGTSSYGVSFNNSSGHAFVDGVAFDNLFDSITCSTGTDRIKLGSGNTHRRIGRYIVNHSSSASQIVKSTILDQYIYEASLSGDGRPQLTPPISNPKFATSQYQTFRGTLRSISNNADLGVDFEQLKSVLTSPGAWGGAFSLYNVGGDGETRINTNPDVSLLPGYVTIGGTAYYLVASGVGGEYYARLWNGVTAVAGDYRGALNAALVVSVKYASFATA
ncbi:hypothetical protein GHO41_07340 [Pseudomonas sp. FSL R10-0399]|uniref:hypothetical protein n=1 Tax=Pseudomonas sp. FSL R10-0399 TaxID=2662194 RepID=UPI00129505C0|nr:hypothetical protein [Pseudomonas sp. FSL R10-0399]MQT57162.1 hypothetical protein [Pseudomonas sp. FSL R10-0399]